MRDPHLYPAMSPRALLLLPVAMMPSLVASLGGSLATAMGLQSWYPTLVKPFFNPPDVVFPLVWTFLFALMAIAFWRILRLKPEAGARGRAIGLFLLQMALNLGWSYAFFGLRSPLAGLLVIGALIIAIALTIRAFRPLDRASAFALYPYLAWVGFAALLNAAIFVLNR
ncbi:COG3476 Tryptophan-rich sensory protein (mitochondrial benzodiazepine receptor homolog) [Rhabdaerophilaceae bacterium]